MIPTIGFLLCVYLTVKGFELLAMQQRWATYGAVIAFVFAPLFALLFIMQSAMAGAALGSPAAY